MDTNIINLSILPPRERHATFFSHYNQLASGESMTISNDHDPRPLFYQLQAEQGQSFTWEYLEEGPEVWTVRVGLKAGTPADETLGEIVGRDMRSIPVFKQYDLDFCCGGKKTLREACAEKSIDPEDVLQAISESSTQSQPSKALPYDEWSLSFLADFIVNTHHQYALKTLPDLVNYAQRVAMAHGENHPEMDKVKELVLASESELRSHMMKEEQILFPYIRSMETSGQNGVSKQQGNNAWVQQPIRVMEMEHETVGNNFATIRELTSGYALPQDACTTYQLFFKILEEFEDDLHLHIHLENNILFPKAIAMEKELLMAAKP
jgi:regulator of cell morphogenesis and NO signaling